MRFKSLFVIARNSRRTYKGARRRREAGRSRIGRPLRAGREHSGGRQSRSDHRTAHRYEHWGHIFGQTGLMALSTISSSFRTRSPRSVVGAIAPKLEKAEIERAERKTTEILDAYDLFLRGLAKFYHW